MRFYTNVQMVGDNFLVRGYEDGKHFMTREKFYPTLFVPSNKKTKYQTLKGGQGLCVGRPCRVDHYEPGPGRECASNTRDRDERRVCCD